MEYEAIVQVEKRTLPENKWFWRQSLKFVFIVALFSLIIGLLPLFYLYNLDNSGNFNWSDFYRFANLGIGLQVIAIGLLVVFLLHRFISSRYLKKGESWNDEYWQKMIAESRFSAAELAGERLISDMLKLVIPAFERSLTLHAFELGVLPGRKFLAVKLSDGYEILAGTKTSQIKSRIRLPSSLSVVESSSPAQQPLFSELDFGRLPVEKKKLVLGKMIQGQDPKSVLQNASSIKISVPKGTIAVADDLVSIKTDVSDSANENNGDEGSQSLNSPRTGFGEENFSPAPDQDEPVAENGLQISADDEGASEKDASNSPGPFQPSPPRFNMGPLSGSKVKQIPGNKPTSSRKKDLEPDSDPLPN